MGTTTNPRTFKISPKFYAQDWHDLKLDADNPDEAEWSKAADILKDRLEGRFLTPAQVLIDLDKIQAESTFGFAILALDFLVLETIEGFREGLTNHNRQSENLFVSFMSQWVEFQACVPMVNDRATKASDLYKQGRCALHHSGTTDRIIVRRGETFDMLTFNADRSIEINRTKFHEGLCNEFNRYLASLRDRTNVDGRKKMQAKMAAICRI